MHKTNEYVNSTCELIRNDKIVIALPWLVWLGMLLLMILFCVTVGGCGASPVNSPPQTERCNIQHYARGSMTIQTDRGCFCPSDYCVIETDGRYNITVVGYAWISNSADLLGDLVDNGSRSCCSKPETVIYIRPGSYVQFNPCN